MGNNSSNAGLSSHTSIQIKDSVYIWGGSRPWPRGASSLKESVEVFNVKNSTLETRPTTGTPHSGLIRYTSCSVGDDIYYFGGFCDYESCHVTTWSRHDHDELSVLNTKNMKWKQIACNNDGPAPKKRQLCRMIPFKSDDGCEDYILVIGFGPFPYFEASLPPLPDPRQYVPPQGPAPWGPLPPPRYVQPHASARNEVHIMCVSRTPGKWSVPAKTGHNFPLSRNFSISTLSNNRAVIFGGTCYNEYKQSIYYSENVFIVSYDKHTVNFQKLETSATNVPRPREDHSSVMISIGVEKHYLLVLGGSGEESLADCWFMEITSKNSCCWKPIVLHDAAVTNRFGHSMTCYNVSACCKWLIISGGTAHSRKPPYISSPHRLMIVELVFSPEDNCWTVNNVLNEEDMKNKEKYTDLLQKASSIRVPLEKIMKQQKDIILHEDSLKKKHMQALSQTPSLEASFEVLQGGTAIWYDIGYELKVPFNDRDVIRTDPHLTSANMKLEAVLNKWIVGRTSGEVSWRYLIQVCEKLKRPDLVNEIEKHLGI